MTIPMPPPTDQEKAILAIKQSVLAIKTSVSKIEQELPVLRETIAIYARNVIEARTEISEEIESLRTDLAKSRDYRFGLEEQQINTQLQRVEQDANELRKQLEEIQKAKSTGNTSERIEAVAQRVFAKQEEEIQKTKQVESKTKLEKRKDVAINAAIASAAVLVSGVLIKLLIPGIEVFLRALATGGK